MARSALGIAGPKQLTSPDYWRTALSLSEDTFAQLLTELGIRPRVGLSKLPKGSVKKLRRWVKQRGLEPPVSQQPQVAAVIPEAFVWKTAGNHGRVESLTAEQIEQLHWQLVKDFEGSDDPIVPSGVKSQHLLESAASRPETGNGPFMKYQTAEMAAAAIFHSLAHNHAFHNGNKRTGLVSMLVQLDKADLTLTCGDIELFKFVLRVGQHRIVPLGNDLSDREVMEIGRWVTENSRSVGKLKKPITWRRLRKNLIVLGCLIDSPGEGKFRIVREVTHGKRFRIKADKRELRASVQCGSDGQELSLPTINRLRTELELDEQHGVDSVAFYSPEQELDATDFIVKYRKTLRRLANF